MNKVKCELDVRPTLAEWIDKGGLPWESRNARVESSTDGLAVIVLDDDGEGEYRRTVTDHEANLLVGAGLLIDAR